MSDKIKTKRRISRAKGPPQKKNIMMTFSKQIGILQIQVPTEINGFADCCPTSREDSIR